MAKGIIYVMTSVVPGLIKIGKTDLNNFESRMYNLERHGYANVAGLKRKFAIEVDDYDEKEKLLDEIFSKSRVPGTELFALDEDLVIQLLSSFEGTQVYPKEESKKDVFISSARELEAKAGIESIPNGEYSLSRNVRGYGKVEGLLLVKDGELTLKADAKCAPMIPNSPEVVKLAPIVDGVLQRDLICNSPSMAAWVLVGRNTNGWIDWKNKDGEPIDIYRKINKD